MPLAILSFQLLKQLYVPQPHSMTKSSYLVNIHFLQRIRISYISL